MNTKQLKYVLVLAKEGSFSRAAETLNISQPSLSQYVRKIEKEVGIPLFDRTGIYVRLTDAGRVYIEAGRKILDLEREMSGAFSDIAQLKSGTVTVGISPFRCYCIMPRVATKFAEAYPGITLVIDERSGWSLFDGAEHGEFDLCISTVPVNKKLFVCEHITDEELLLAVREGSPQEKKLTENSQQPDGAKYPKVDIGLINGESFITLDEVQIMQKRLNEICAEYGITVKESVRSNSIESQLSMVKAGLGMALIPSTSLVRSEGIKAFSVLQPLDKREIVFISRPDSRESAAVRKLKEIIKEVCSEL